VALIYMVRHGQTVWNVDKRFRGTIDVPLNEKGRRDAQRAAAHLADAGLEAVYTSPLSRAREVAEAIAGAELARPELPEGEPEPWASATPVPGSSVAMPSGYGPSRGRTTPGW